MGWRLLESARGERVYAVLADQGADVLRLLTRLARIEELSEAQLAGVGGFRSARVGWFDRDAGDYVCIDVDEQWGRLSLYGDISRGDDDRPTVRLRTLLELPDGGFCGGVLLAGTVCPALEAVVREVSRQPHRRQVRYLPSAFTGRGLSDAGQSLFPPYASRPIDGSGNGSDRLGPVPRLGSR